MATVQDLKRRIRSIRNTRKITKAMELVASARLRRAQARIEAMRPYADRMTELMIGTARASTSLQGLALLQRREVQKAAIVPLTGDRGLAGAFNAQVLRHAFALERQLRERRGRGALAGGRARRAARRSASAATRSTRAGSASATGPPTTTRRRSPARRPSSTSSGEVDRVVIVYNQFVSALVQRVVERDLLPIPEEALGQGRGRGAARRRCSATSSTSPSPRRSCSGCCRSTSRPSSTARCSSRPRRSRARG